MQMYLDLQPEGEGDDVAEGFLEALPAAKRFQMLKLILRKCPAGCLESP